MAEGGKAQPTGGNSWDTWFGGWVQTAKEKSSSALEFMKKDLSEFTNTMQQETEKVMEMTGATLKSDTLGQNTAQATHKVKAGLTSFLDNISKALVIPPEDDQGVPMKVAADGSGIYDRGKARLHALQLDASTYMDPPRGSPEQYKMWVESFDMDRHKGEVSELLVSKVEVRALYTKLVPNEVSHAEFWQRYFYRVHQLDCDEARKQALMKRAEQVKGDSMSWDDDDWSGGEEDDGNQSDWEKMPRPHQTSTDRKSSPSTDPSRTQPPASPHPADHTTSHSPRTEPSPETTASSSAQKTSNVDAESAPTQSHRESSPLTPPQPEPCGSFTQNVCAGAQDQSHCSQGEGQSRVQAEPPSADLWSLHIPEDTASGGGQLEETSACQPGSTSDVPALASPPPSANSPLAPHVDRASRNDGSCAAGGGEGRLLNVDPQPGSAHLVADGACGAVEVMAGSSSPGTNNNEVPAASEEKPSSSVPEQQQASSLPCPPASIARGLDTIEAVKDQDTIETVRDQDTTETVRDQDTTETVRDQDTTETARDQDTTETVRDQDTIDSETVKAEVQREVAMPTGQKDEVQPEVAMPTGQSDQDLAEQLPVRVKGDMVVVGDTHSSDSSDTNKESESANAADELGEDWDEDFDIEVTEDDLKAAEDVARKLGDKLGEEDDDWENWE